MVDFPLQDLMDYRSCYDLLLGVLHPEGLHCPNGHLLPPDQKPHKYRTNKLPCFRCRQCGKVYNLFSGTLLSSIHLDVPRIVVMLRGFLRGETTAQLSRDLKYDYDSLHRWRHLLQETAFENRMTAMLDDPIVESDEVFINAGEKGKIHADAEDPPRVRANKKKA